MQCFRKVTFFSLESKYHHNQYVKLFFSSWLAHFHTTSIINTRKWWIFFLLWNTGLKAKANHRSDKGAWRDWPIRAPTGNFDVSLVLNILIFFFSTQNFKSFSDSLKRKLMSVITIRIVFIYVFLRKLFFSACRKPDMFQHFCMSLLPSKILAL